jgi:hypothetical protein
MFPVGFELNISAGERQHTHALNRAATGTGKYSNVFKRKYNKKVFFPTYSAISYWM